MHTDPNTMNDWELAYSLTELADRSHKHDAALIRVAVRRLSDLAEQQGESSFVAPTFRPMPTAARTTWAQSYSQAADDVARRAGRQSDPPFRPMMGSAPAAYASDTARDDEDGAQ